MHCLTGLAFCITLGIVMGALRNECSSDPDCPSTHCCVTDYHGKYCSAYQNVSQPCHLPGHSLHTYHCNCAPGYSCQPMHLTADASLAQALHQVEEILTHTGYGTCQIVV
ncbi:neurogenic locus protein delta-like [Crassostrea angulata]|uniref:EGF-like domain-containing protein n=1 Tax=Magallana gigas TaxID=29159 RepID=A0A8W8HWS6_MAGGI|nr:neurogenic locus protein delta-like [Crassostrea gigas]XP_052698480.1 neurogenic locus protein delta-like [Crassostrea angulata]|eukprot:XP_011457034.1 PREDICTED: neurogenic locus protein delta-like [Crassostrea gigas]